jgi:hypothetical protein
MKIKRLVCLASGIAIFSVSAVCFGTAISFEGLTDSASVGSAYSGLGVNFSSTTVLTAGISLNEFEFPPHSGNNVVFDDGGPLRGTFSTPVSFLSAYLTYMVPVTLYAYDSSGSVIGSVSSASLANTVSSGGTPNELLALSSAGGIQSFAFVGDTIGGSFTLDDFSFTPAGAVPDGGSCAALFGISLAALRFFLRRCAAPGSR